MRLGFNNPISKMLLKHFMYAYPNLIKCIKGTKKDLGGVCFFHLMLNITFFELNTE